MTENDPEDPPDPELQEVGVVGADLPFWRAKEAIRHAEIRLAGQAQANQALEGRATSILGWSVTGLLALGPVYVGHTYRVAAVSAGLCLGVAALLCVVCIRSRDFQNLPGYEPRILLEDQSQSEFEALVALAKGYQNAAEHNTRAEERLRRLLGVAIVALALAVPAGLLFLLTIQTPTPGDLPLIPIRAASASAVCRSVLGFSEHTPSSISSCGELRTWPAAFHTIR